MIKNKVNVILFLFFFSAVLVGCNNEDYLKSNELEDTDEITVHPKLLVDRDALLERLHYVDDFIGKEYQDEQLKEMGNDSIYQDYKEVLQNFVQEELNQELASFQTTGDYDDTRWMAVTTKDERVYKISLKQRNDYNEIWTVDSYAELWHFKSISILD